MNLQPAGEYLGEDYYHAGGVPAVFGQLIEQGLIDETAMTANGKTVGENYRGAVIVDENVIRPFDNPLKERAGFRVLTGNIFHSAVMKMSVISPEFRDRYLSNPDHPNRFEGRAVVFDGPEDYHHRIDDPALAIDENTMLFMRGAGPKGYPGRGRGREHARARLPAEARDHQPRLRRRRPAVGHLGLAVDPQRLARGGVAGRARADRDRRQGACSTSTPGRLDVEVDDAELAARRRRLEAAGGYHYPDHQTPWQEIQRGLVGELETGAVLEVGGEVPADRADQGHPARQPLTRALTRL